MSQVRIRDGRARLSVGAAQPAEARDMAVAYLERRGWATVGEAEVSGGQRVKAGVMGLRVWQVTVGVVRA